MANPWFRVYTEMVDDEKLRLLAFEDRWHYVAILCCKGKGMLDCGDDHAMVMRKLSVKLGLTVRETETVLMRLHEVGLVDADTAIPTGWDDRQFISDSSTERVKAYREKMKRKGNVSVTAQDTDTDTDTDTKKSLKAIRPAASDVDEEFEIAWRAYPKRAGGNSKAGALKAWTARRKQGVPADEMISGVRRYAAYIIGTGRERTEYVKQAETFFGPGLHFQGEYAMPVQPAPAPSAPSKAMQTIIGLEASKRERMDPNGNRNGLPAANLPWTRAATGNGSDGWNGSGVGNGSLPQQGVGSGLGRAAIQGRILDHDGD